MTKSVQHGVRFAPLGVALPWQRRPPKSVKGMYSPWVWGVGGHRIRVYGDGEPCRVRYDFN
jgi:hypothetical protein